MVEASLAIGVEALDDGIEAGVVVKEGHLADTSGHTRSERTLDGAVPEVERWGSRGVLGVVDQ